MSYNGENPVGSEYLSDWSTQLIPSNNARVREYWLRAFRIVQYSNVLIDAIDAIEEGSTVFAGQEEKRAELSGEARFFRALMYRTLVALYGGVPIFDEAVSSPKTDLVRASEAEVYNFVIADLVFAAANLPSKGEEAQPGRITQGAAKHLLAEVYNSVGSYDLAIAAATSVINDYGYALMTSRLVLTIQMLYYLTEIRLM